MTVGAVEPHHNARETLTYYHYHTEFIKGRVLDAALRGEQMLLLVKTKSKEGSDPESLRSTETQDVGCVRREGQTDDKEPGGRHLCGDEGDLHVP